MFLHVYINDSKIRITECIDNFLFDFVFKSSITLLEQLISLFDYKALFFLKKYYK